MMKRINEAYSLIEHAPLRFHIETYPVAAQKRQQASYQNESQKRVDRDTLPITDRFEFWVRFVFGAIFGVFMSVRVFLDMYPSPVAFIPLTAGLVLGYGDKFWYAVFERWWLWG